MRFSPGSKLGEFQAEPPRRSSSGTSPPALVAELAGAGNGVGAPHLGAGAGVVGRHPAAGVEVIAAGHAGHDAPLDDHRAAGVVLADGPVADRDVPLDLAGPRVQGHEVGVVGGDVQLVAVEGAVAVDAGQRRRVLDTLPAVLPDARAVAHVEGLDEVARLHQGTSSRRARAGWFPAGPPPWSRPMPAAGGRRWTCLIWSRGAVPPVAVGPPPHRPVPGRRIEQHGLGHRRVAVGDGLRRRGRTGGQEAGGGRRPRPRRVMMRMCSPSRGGLACRCPGAVARRAERV